MSLRRLRKHTLGPIIAALVVAPSAGLVGCGKKEVPAAADSASPAPQPDATSGVGGEDKQPRRDPEPVAEVKAGAEVPKLPGPFATNALRVIPKSAPFVFAFAPKKILDGLGYASLLETYALLIAEPAGQMKELAGKDLWKLESWAEIGVDLDAPGGVFMIDLDTPAVVTFFRLSAADKLEAFVKGLFDKMGRPVTFEKVGEVTVADLGRDRNALLLRGDTVFIVSKLFGNGATAIAKELGARTEADSLMASTDLNAALDGLGADEAAAWVQLKAIADKTMAAKREEMAQPSYDALLEEAKKTGDAEQLKRVEAVIAEAKADFERNAKRHAAEVELQKAILGELSTVAVGLDLRPDGVEAKARVALAEGGKLRGILKNGSGVLPFLATTKSQPLMAFGGQLDIPTYLGIFEQMLAAEGDEGLAEARKGLKEQLGLDLDKDLLGAFSGEFGFSLTGTLAEMVAAKDPRQSLGGTLVLGLKDAATVDTLAGILAKVAALPGAEEALKWDAEKKTLTATGMTGSPITVGFVEGRLVASTDPAAGDNLKAGQGWGESVSNAGLKALVGRTDLAGFFAVRQAFIGAWLFLAGGGDYRPELPQDASAEVKAKLAELEALDAKIKPLRNKVESERMAPVVALFEKLGTFAEVAHMDDKGAALTLGIYPDGATVAEVLAGAVALRMQVDKKDGEGASEDEKALRELEDQRWKIERELWHKAQPVEIEDKAVEPAEKAVPPSP